MLTIRTFYGHDLGAVCKMKNELYLGSCFPIYQSASSSSSHNQVRRGSDHWHRHRWEIYRTTLTNPCNNLQKSMYQCWQTPVCSKLEKSMCSSSGHNQVRRGSDHWHRHRWSWTEVSFQSSLCSVSNNVSFCLFFCELELSNILLHFDTSLVLTITTRENAEPNIIIKNKEISHLLSLFPILFLFCVKQNASLLLFFANWNFPTFCYISTLLWSSQ